MKEWKTLMSLGYNLPIKYLLVELSSYSNTWKSQVVIS